jgi:hypothetical protein
MHGALTAVCAQRAYSTGVLASAQFSELEELQTEQPTFIEEGARERKLLTSFAVFLGGLLNL